MKLNLNTFLIAVIVTILIVFFTRECTNSKYIKALETETKIHDSKELIFELSKNKLDQEIATQKAIVRYKDNQLAKEIAETANLKNIIAGIKIRVITHIKPERVFLDTIITFIDSTKCLVLPIKFKRGDQWWNETGTITEDGYLESDSLTFTSEPMIAIGYKKRTLKTLLKASELVVVYRDKNPYAHIKELENIVIQEKPRKFGIGLQVGYGLSMYGLSPTISIGINYNLIKF